MAEDGVVALPRPGAGVTDDPLLPVLRQGARRMPMQAIEAEVEAFLAARAALVDDQGRGRLVRNGHAPERRLPSGIGLGRSTVYREVGRAGIQRGVRPSGTS